MHNIQVVPKCAHVERRHSACERSLSVVDGDGVDRDGRAGHGVRLTNAQTWDNIRYYDQFSWLWNFLGFGTNEHILNAAKTPITC